MYANMKKCLQYVVGEKVLDQYVENGPFFIFFSKTNDHFVCLVSLCLVKRSGRMHVSLLVMVTPGEYD